MTFFWLAKITCTNLFHFSFWTKFLKQKIILGLVFTGFYVTKHVCLLSKSTFSTIHCTIHMIECCLFFLKKTLSEAFGHTKCNRKGIQKHILIFHLRKLSRFLGQFLTKTKKNAILRKQKLRIMNFFEKWQNIDHVYCTSTYSLFC